MSERKTASFRFGPVRQEVGSKHVRQGDLLEAVNVRQTAKAGVYAKRRGFARTAHTFSGGTLSGSPVEVLPGVGNASLMRDSGDQLWARSNTANSWTLMGTHKRPWVDTAVVQSNLYTTPQPFSCLVGSSLWVFALGTWNTSVEGYEFSIIDAVTGVVTTAKQSITATDIVHASAAYDGTYVWVFWVKATGSIYCHKFTAATPTVAPVATTYYTLPSSPTDVSGVTLQQVQARYFSVPGKVMVTACGGVYSAYTYKRAAVNTVLDPATGLAVAVGANAAAVPLASSAAASPNSNYIGGLYILDGQNGSGTYWYYAFFTGSPYDESYKIQLVRVTNGSNSTASIVSSDGTIYVGGEDDPFPQPAIALSGFVPDTAVDLQVLAYTNVTQPITTPSWYNCVTGVKVRSAGSWLIDAGGHPSVTDVPDGGLRMSWLASGFVKLGTSWYFITGYDDWVVNQTAMGVEGNSLQRGYHLREIVIGTYIDTTTCNILAQYQMGAGSAVFHRASGAIVYPENQPVVTCISPVHAFGNTLVSAAAVSAGVTGYVDVAFVKVDTAKVYGKGCQAMGLAFCPGNIPVVFNGQTPAHEIAPIMFPPPIEMTSAGTGSDFSIMAVVYAIYGEDGSVWRSAPSILSTTIGHGATLNVQYPLFHLGDGEHYYTEIYLGNNALPKLQAAYQGSGDEDRTFEYTTPTVANMVNGETLYTTGNALSQAWPVACQTMGTWQNRIFAAQKNTLWVSKELEAGFGPIFNEVQKSIWTEERNDITAMAPVDWNYFGVASADQVAVISGPGPDGVGNGNYVLKTLPSWTGVTAGGVAIQGAQGMYYQNKTTGRIMCLTPSLQVIEAAGGAYDYASYTFSIAAWYESENLMLFFAPLSGAAIAIDYQHPQDVAPFGQVYLWTFSAGFVPAAACRDDSGLLVVNSLGSIYRPSASQWVDDKVGGTDTYQMRLTTAELQLGDLQGSFNLNKLQTLLTMRGASGVVIDVYPGYVSTAVISAALTSLAPIDLPAPTYSGDPEAILTRPPNCMRIQSFRVVILEKAGVSTQSFEFEGVAVECNVTGRLLRPREGRVI